MPCKRRTSTYVYLHRCTVSIVLDLAEGYQPPTNTLPNVMRSQTCFKFSFGDFTMHTVEKHP